MVSCQKWLEETEPGTTVHVFRLLKVVRVSITKLTSAYRTHKWGTLAFRKQDERPTKVALPDTMGPIVKVADSKDLPISFVEHRYMAETQGGSPTDLQFENSTRSRSKNG